MVDSGWGVVCAGQSAAELDPWIRGIFSPGILYLSLPLGRSAPANSTLSHFSCTDPSSCPFMQHVQCGHPALLLWLLHHSRIKILDPPPFAVVY
ncbi:hypothetical protein K443DRAFT_428468 [Laccaria amethystina LaAM-08-1]|uniref:Uncharacterized protein n=1 Tax=Laccaria amethystina LaAM-08-1 TaxID=1095629 RepID=A0A0C9WP83_9AGAR|nr:hypothetical protein K443DRAFT_428468 [Laccaria amethystina LaAM-08-1]